MTLQCIERLKEQNVSLNDFQSIFILSRNIQKIPNLNLSNEILRICNKIEWNAMNFCLNVFLAASFMRYMTIDHWLLVSVHLKTRMKMKYLENMELDDNKMKFFKETEKKSSQKRRKPTETHRNGSFEVQFYVFDATEVINAIYDRVYAVLIRKKPFDPSAIGVEFWNPQSTGSQSQTKLYLAVPFLRSSAHRSLRVLCSCILPDCFIASLFCHPSHGV